MSPTELKKLDNLVQDLNAKFNESKTLQEFIRFTKKINLKDEATFKEVKYEIDLMYDRLLEEQNDNTW
jgi:hypothetical protein